MRRKENELIQAKNAKIKLQEELNESIREK
jgi:hypothetical protein